MEGKVDGEMRRNRFMDGFRLSRSPEEQDLPPVEICTSSVRIVQSGEFNDTYFESHPGCFRNIKSIVDIYGNDNVVTVMSGSYIERRAWYGSKEFRFVYPNYATALVDYKKICERRGWNLVLKRSLDD